MTSSSSRHQAQVEDRQRSHLSGRATAASTGTRSYRTATVDDSVPLREDEDEAAEGGRARLTLRFVSDCGGPLRAAAGAESVLSSLWSRRAGAGFAEPELAAQCSALKTSPYEPSVSERQNGLKPNSSTWPLPSVTSTSAGELASVSPLRSPPLISSCLTSAAKRTITRAGLGDVVDAVSCA
jgi:hypothetical protein